MRVTILAREFPPAVGGIGDHTDHLASALAARGATVTVVTSAPAEERDAFSVRAVIDEWTGAGVTAIAGAVAATEPDVVLWQYNPFSIGRRGFAPSAGRLARALSACAPLVVSFHELWFPWGRGGLRGIAWAIGQRLQARSVLRAAARWIVTTESRERTLARADAGKVVRIPIGPNVEPAGGAARDALGIPADAFVVGHLGSTGPGRDLDTLFAAIERLRAAGLDARVLLAGKTGPFRKPESLNGAVIATGTLPRAALSPALASADVYVHADPVGPSAGRRTSLVAALAHGLPLVAFRGPDHAGELIEDHNVVLSAHDPAALAATLRALAIDPDRRRALGAAARATFEASFSWERIGRAYLDVLEAL